MDRTGRSPTMDKSATPISNDDLRGVGSSVIEPKLRSSTNPGPTSFLRGVEANTNVDKGKPFTYSDVNPVEYAPGFVCDPFKTHDETGSMC
jgi:hypothetical protein